MISQSEIDKLIAKGRIDENDVLALRRNMYGDDYRISEEEANALFSINDACDGCDSTWPQFFIESIVDFVISQSEPKGYVSQAHADWLITRASSFGIVKSATEIEMLIKLMEAAHQVPKNLEFFVMRQVKQAVLSGDGVTRSGEDLVPGKIGCAEVELLRRILHACGGDDSAAISRSEAEMLFDINDAVSDVTNDASWPDLFVKAIANYLLAVRGFEPPSREEALRREAWLDDDTVDIGSFFGKILAGGLRGVLAGYQECSENLALNKAHDIAISETITEDEASWLSDRIGSDGTIHDAEKALLMFIKTESPNIHPGLKPLIDKVA
jgi:hypothetical protein